MKKSGFIPMDKSNAFAAVVFFVVSIISFFSFVRNSMWNGLSLTIWILSALALLVPIYNMITDNINSKKQAEQN